MIFTKWKHHFAHQHYAAQG